MMAINEYAKKVEQYLNKKQNTKKELDGARGLLAPKSGAINTQQMQQQKDIIEQVGEFVLAIRQKRKELVAQRKGKGK